MGAAVAPSTIAMSVYNFIARRAAPQGAHTVLSDLRASWMPSLEEADITSAVDELVQRGLLKRAGDVVDLVDPKRMVVVSRDRSGDGWGNWKFRQLT